MDISHCKYVRVGMVCTYTLLVCVCMCYVHTVLCKHCVMYVLKFIEMQVLLSRIVKVENELTAELGTESTMNSRGVKTTQTNLNLTQGQTTCFSICLQGAVTVKHVINTAYCLLHDILKALMTKVWIKSKLDHQR